MSDISKMSEIDIVEVCPLCRANDGEVLVTTDSNGVLVKCSCGLRYAKSRITLDRLRGLTHFYVPSAFSHDDFSKRFKQAHEDLSLVETYVDVERPALFDVCAGSGAFMKCARDRGWGVMGNDMSSMCALLAWHKWKIRIVAGEVNCFKEESGDKIDAVTLCNAVEHLRDPVEELGILSSNMADDGVIFIRTPEFTDEQLQEEHQLPHHFFDYDQQTLKTLLRQVGFEMLHYAHTEDPKPTMIMIGRKI